MMRIFNLFSSCFCTKQNAEHEPVQSKACTALHKGSIGHLLHRVRHAAVWDRGARAAPRPRNDVGRIFVPVLFEGDKGWSSRPPTAVAVRSKFQCGELRSCDLNTNIQEDNEISDTSKKEVDRGPAPPAAPRLVTRRRRRRPTAMDGRRHRIYLPKRRRPRR